MSTIHRRLESEIVASERRFIVVHSPRVLLGLFHPVFPHQEMYGRFDQMVHQNNSP